MFGKSAPKPPSTTSRRCGLALLTFTLVVPSFLRSHAGEREKVDFNFQVRPILADRCFKCHGPDAKARKAKLRLDLAESAFAGRDPQKPRRAIVPSHPEQSELVRRITTADEDDRMPPAASNLTLSEEEKDVLQKWIAQGAEYQPHWAFM